jgi:hypothetical protein
MENGPGPRAFAPPATSFPIEQAHYWHFQDVLVRAARAQLDTAAMQRSLWMTTQELSLQATETRDYAMAPENPNQLLRLYAPAA